MCLITNPIWVIKTRLQLQRATSLRSTAAKAARRVSSARASPYRGFTHAVAQIAREEGFAGFYRGLLPSLLLVCCLGLPFLPFSLGNRVLHQLAFSAGKCQGCAHGAFCGQSSAAACTLVTSMTQRAHV